MVPQNLLLSDSVVFFIERVKIMKIYLIAGKAGSGKSEVARYIKEYYIYEKQETVITEYSKYLKLFAKELTDWDGNQANKPRKFLQNIGSYIRNEMAEPKLFVRRMLEDIEIYSNYVDVVVVSDVRYPIEIEEIKKEYPEAVSIYVINQFSRSKLTLEEQMHPSELALEDYTNFDYTIANDDSKTLKDKIFKLLEEEK